jgi:hypothetical protein
MLVSSLFNFFNLSFVEREREREREMSFSGREKEKEKENYTLILSF